MRVAPDCEEYLAEYSQADPDTIALVCGFTEDTNGDGGIDALDCRGRDGQDGSDGSNGSDGADGSDGSDGAEGQDGADGQDGTDGEPCDVVDNGDATCTIQCADSSVIVYNCGDGAMPPPGGAPGGMPDDEPDEPGQQGGLCGAFGGVTIVGMLLPLFWMKRRRNRR